jgi:3-oxoacyl-[acyl-carrier protein] reductase
VNKNERGVVVITGSEGSLGTSLKKVLIDKGREVIGLSRSELDLASIESIDNFCSRLGSTVVEGLVLNASQNIPESLDSKTIFESLQEHLAVNSLGHIRLTLNLLPNMVLNGGSKIVAVSSTYAIRARPGRAPYSISKAALESFVRSVAIEHGESNVLANSVRPGFMDTPLTAKNNSEESMRRLASRIPIARLGTIDETARLIAFLLSNENSYITGQTLTIDGGFAIT